MAKRNLTPKTAPKGGKGKKASAGKNAEDKEEDENPATEEDDAPKPGEDNGAAEGEEEEDTEASEGEDDEDDDTEANEGEDEEEPSAKDVKKIRKAERARIASILRAPEAKGREDLAMSLAFDTNLSAATAVKSLKSAPASGDGGFNKAMRDVGNPKLGHGGQAKTGSDNPIVVAVGQHAAHRLIKPRS